MKNQAKRSPAGPAFADPAPRNSKPAAPVTIHQPLRPVQAVAPVAAPIATPGTAPVPAPVPAPGPAPTAPARSASPTLDAHGYDASAYDWVPVPRRRRADGWTPERQRAFIGHLADTGSVRLAAQHAGMSPSAAYQLRRSPEGRAFAAAWYAAIQQAASALVDAAFERAVHGSEEPVFNKDGKVVGRRLRQSDAMMMFLLRKHFPDRYGDNYRDRAGPAIAATATMPPPVADALALLGPEPPADPAATLDPDHLDLMLARADNGRLPDGAVVDADGRRDHEEGGHEEAGPEEGAFEEAGPDEARLGDDFERRLEEAKRTADALPRRYADPDGNDSDEPDADWDDWGDDDDDDDAEAVDTV